MPNQIFFDLETTSKYWNHANILQVGYIKLSPTSDVLEVYNQFVVPENEVPPSASAVNHLTRNKLIYLSNNQTLGDIADKLFREFSNPDNIICGYNSNVYDIPILQRELNELGYDNIDITPDRRIDLLPIMRKKLVNATSHTLSAASGYVLTHFGIKQSEINKLFCKTTGSQDTQFHGALYDSFMTMTLYLMTRDFEKI